MRRLLGREHRGTGSRNGFRLVLLLLLCTAQPSTTESQSLSLGFLPLPPLSALIAPRSETDEAEEEETPIPNSASVPDSRVHVQSHTPIFIAPKPHLWFSDDIGWGYFRTSRDPLEKKRSAALKHRILGAQRYDEMWFGRRADRSVNFASFESTDQAHYMTLGIKHAARGTLERGGWRSMLTIGFKIAEYDPRLDRSGTRPHNARALIGPEFHHGPLSVAVLGGASFSFHQIGLMLERQRLGRIGGAGMVDFWWSWRVPPIESLRFTSGYLMADGAERSLSGRLRHGFAWRDTPIRYGPEITFSGGLKTRFRGQIIQDSWRNFRFGGHVSEIETGWAFLSFAGGLEIRQNQEPGFYAQITTYMRY